jgi:hypothetical protein
LDSIAAGEALSRLYSASRLLVNFFLPSFKLAEKKRVGARVSKRYYAPETPCARLLASRAIPKAMNEWLRVVLATLDPSGSSMRFAPSSITWPGWRPVNGCTCFPIVTSISTGS